jgi:hypothetical protein
LGRSSDKEELDFSFFPHSLFLVESTHFTSLALAERFVLLVPWRFFMRVLSVEMMEDVRAGFGGGRIDGWKRVILVM